MVDSRCPIHICSINKHVKRLDEAPAYVGHILSTPPQKCFFFEMRFIILLLEATVKNMISCEEWFFLPIQARKTRAILLLKVSHARINTRDSSKNPGQEVSPEWRLFASFKTDCADRIVPSSRLPGMEPNTTVVTNPWKVCVGTHRRCCSHWRDLRFLSVL